MALQGLDIGHFLGDLARVGHDQHVEHAAGRFADVGLDAVGDHGFRVARIDHLAHFLIQAHDPDIRQARPAVITRR
ncbi:hypothetical protein LP420_20270 [Massilia sp. B-10]|nr:hypothetical protein LP420_20270 [Massilia sp. B-10]